MEERLCLQADTVLLDIYQRNVDIQDQHTMENANKESVDASERHLTYPKSNWQTTLAVPREYQTQLRNMQKMSLIAHHYVLLF